MSGEGFQENFLGDEFITPLPTHSSDDYGECILLPYTHFTVRFNPEKRLAYYSAFNSQRPFGKGRSDKWHYDPRIEKSRQVGNEFYENNPWDRGHLAGREFLEWGESGGRADEDSFVWTNITPQHENMHRRHGGEWSHLENYLQEIMQNQARDTKMSFFAGCVFRDNDIELRAKKKNDTIHVPQQFWMVAIWVDRNTNMLRSVGYIVQNYTINDDGTINDDPSSSFDPHDTTNIEDIEALTGFKFADDIRMACL